MNKNLNEIKLFDEKSNFVIRCLKFGKILKFYRDIKNNKFCQEHYLIYNQKPYEGPTLYEVSHIEEICLICK